MPHISINWKHLFFTVWFGQAISLIGSALVQFALIWWMAQKTQSAMVLATASLMSLIPNAILSPFGGVLVDRWNRRLIMIYADTIVALATLVLAILFWMGIAEIWHIYVALFIRSIGNVQTLAMRASTSLMVPETHLSRVAGYNQILNNIIRIGAPMLGAILIGLIPLQAILMIDVSTAMLGIIPLFFVPIPQPVHPANAEHPQKASIWDDLKKGIQYVIAWRGLLYVILMLSTVLFLLDPAFALVPILVIKHFHGGAIHLASLDSAFSIGGLISGLLMSAWVIHRKVVVSFLGVIGVGIGCIVLGIASASAFWLAISGMIIIAVMMGISDAPIGAVLQARIAPEMQGRVFGVMGSLGSILSPLGLILAGWLSDTIGVQFWFVIGGIQCILIGFIALRVPAILQMESQPSNV